jgi:hypothetical protein
MKDDEDAFKLIKYGIAIASVLILSMWAYCNFISPNIYIWQQSMAGQAELAHAEYSRQIATCEAQAKK